MKQTKVDVLRKMKQGGHFASALAEAWLYADERNQGKLMHAFGDLYEQFEKPEAPVSNPVEQLHRVK